MGGSYVARLHRAQLALPNFLELLLRFVAGVALVIALVYATTPRTPQSQPNRPATHLPLDSQQHPTSLEEKERLSFLQPETGTLHPAILYRQRERALPPQQTAKLHMVAPVAQRAPVKAASAPRPQSSKVSPSYRVAPFLSGADGDAAPAPPALTPAPAGANGYLSSDRWSPAKTAWPLTVLRSCRTADGAMVFNSCHGCATARGHAPRGPVATVVPQRTMDSSTGGNDIGCRCGTVTLPPVPNVAPGTTRTQCLNYLKRVDTAATLAPGATRQCGTTDCSHSAPTTDTPGGCTFDVLLRNLPRSVPAATNLTVKQFGAPAPMQPMRAWDSVPVLCSGLERIHERFQAEHTNEVAELFPAVDNGEQPRLHGLLMLQNGCFQANGCKEQLAYKLDLKGEQEGCTGFGTQQISNGSHCVKSNARENREVCSLPHAFKGKRLHFPKLVVKTVSPWNTFQHFVLDKLGFLISAIKQVEGDPNVSFLLHLDERDKKLVQFLGLPSNRVVPFHSSKQYCANQLYVDVELPGRFGKITEARFPRPPEMFLDSALFLQQRLRVLTGTAGPPVRDRIVWLGRGSGRAQQKGSNIDNEQEVLELLRCYGRSNPYQRLELVVVDPATLSFKDLMGEMARARVILGVHGGQMSNIIFAQPDKNTAVIEVVGRQVEFKSYYYSGLAAALSYYYVPRLCLVPGRDQREAVVRHAWGKPTRGMQGIPHNCASPKAYVFASLHDVRNALDLALGAPQSTTCQRPTRVPSSTAERR